MNIMALDTYQFINNLKATGLSEQQAVVISNGIKEISQNCDYLSKKDFEIASSNFLTKSDFEEASKKFLTKEEFYEATRKFLTKEEFYEATRKFLTKEDLDHAMNGLRAEFNAGFKEIRHELLVKLGLLVCGVMTLGITSLGVLIKSI